MIRKIFIFSILFLVISLIEGYGQVSIKGVPPSFTNQDLATKVPLVVLNAPQTKLIDEVEYDKYGALPLEIGKTINTDFNLNNSGVWSSLPNGDRMWRLSLQSKGAEALNVYFTNFYIPDYCELFIYNESGNMVLGAYTSDNNSPSGIFSTELLEGDQITIELIQSKRVKENPTFTINEIGHVYRYSGFRKGTLKDFGDSDPCEINVNCLEGDNWKKQKQGVARIMVKVRNSISWCTGTLLNNVRRDFTPYFYTAEHCGRSADETDYNNWVFYFNYESADCETPIEEPSSNTINGGQLLAEVSLSEGSDFKLLLLNEDVPPVYNPYFNGWTKQDQGSTSGVTIHHPYGDIKKISTYTEALISTTYEGETTDLNGSFWKVVWAETFNGHGVTEGGSSGSPLFNSDGLVIGALTGGGATCTNPTAPDYYGKLAHSWDKFASNNTDQLKVWLDPDNTGITSISGLDYNQDFFIPEFRADTVIVPVGRPVDFKDLSIGNINSWDWTFHGANIAKFDVQNPQDIVYPNIGVYDVKLEIRNNSQIDSIVKPSYIKVVPIVTPIPTADQITVYLGVNPVSEVEFTVYDESGREVKKFYSADAIKRKVLSLSEFRAGFYFLKVQTSEFVQVHKIAVL